MTIDRENDSTFSFVNRLFYFVSCKVKANDGKVKQI